ncbi:MAG: hypothetical protein ACI89F_000972, partial [Porticoccaceae bacterium]
ACSDPVGQTAFQPDQLSLEHPLKIPILTLLLAVATP